MIVNVFHLTLDTLPTDGTILVKRVGVIILVKSSLQSFAKPEYNTDCENLWIQLNMLGSKSVLVGASYKPQGHDPSSFEKFNKSLSLIKQTGS